jgi:hypothetical protein
LLDLLTFGEFRFDLRREIMDVNRLPVDNSPSGGPPTTYGSLHFCNRHWPIVRHALKDISINTPDDSIVCLTQPCGTLSDRVKHWLEISWRAGDYAQDLARCGLLLAGLLQFFGSCILPLQRFCELLAEFSIRRPLADC